MRESMDEQKGALKVLHFIELPFHWIALLTIPPVDIPMFFRNQQYIYPFTSIFFSMWSKNLLTKTAKIAHQEIPYWAFAILLSLILFGVAVICSRKVYKPTPRGLFLTLTIVSGLVWLDLVVSIICDTITLVQLWTNASSLFCGMTLLGIGNSTIDVLVDITLAKKGFQVMAITGIFSGQSFNLLIGFALSALTKGIRKPASQFKIFNWKELFVNKKETMTFLIIASCAVVLIFVWALLIKLKYTFGKSVGYTLMITYCVIFAGFLGMEVLWKH